jgi:hypothetical protein
MTNLSRLKTLVATETGGLIALDRIVRLSLPERSAQVQAAIDRYLIKRFDYEIHAYTEPTTKSTLRSLISLREPKLKQKDRVRRWRMSVRACTTSPKHAERLRLWVLKSSPAPLG